MSRDTNQLIAFLSPRLNSILLIQNDNGFTNVPQSSDGRLLQQNSPFVALIFETRETKKKCSVCSADGTRCDWRQVKIMLIRPWKIWTRSIIFFSSESSEWQVLCVREECLRELL